MSKNRKEKPFYPKQYERPGISEDEILEIKEAFDLFDPDKTGFINPKELKDTMDSLGFDDRSKVIYDMLEEYDDNDDQKIDFSEFLNLMTARMSENDSKEDMKKVFKLFDEDGNGYVEVNDLKRIAKELSENMDEMELKEMIERADSDGDGKVSFDDFYEIMTKKSFIQFIIQNSKLSKNMNDIDIIKSIIDTIAIFINLKNPKFFAIFSKLKISFKFVSTDAVLYYYIYFNFLSYISSSFK